MTNGKYLHLPRGSVLIPFLQTAPSEDLRKLFKETNAGNKEQNYY